jgi:hypothetical protein
MLSTHLGQSILGAAGAAHHNTLDPAPHKVDREQFPVAYVAPKDDCSGVSFEGCGDAFKSGTWLHMLIYPYPPIGAGEAHAIRNLTGRVRANCPGEGSRALGVEAKSVRRKGQVRMHPAAGGGLACTAQELLAGSSNEGVGQVTREE